MSSHRFNPAFGATTSSAPPAPQDTLDRDTIDNSPWVANRPDEGAQEPNNSMRSSWMKVKSLLPSSDTRDSLDAASAKDSDVDRSNGAAVEIDSSMSSKIKSASMKMESGKLLGIQRRHIRSAFLIFSLVLTSFTIASLAVFGSQATDTAQLQTVGLLGEALVRDVSKELSSLTSNAEQTCLDLAVKAPSYFKSSVKSASMNDSSKNASSFLWATDMAELMFASLNAENRPGVSWHGFYYARSKDGMTIGVTNTYKYKNGNSSESRQLLWECWGNLGYGSKTQRTLPSQQPCNWQDVMSTTQETGKVYEYDARGRPWYKRAMKYRGKIIWTEPYVFSSTGKTGITVALATEAGAGYHSYEAQHKDLGVYAIDITISGLETLFSELSHSIKTSDFGSQIADVGIVDRNASRHAKHSSEIMYEALLASSATARTRLGELGTSKVQGSLISQFFNSEDANIQQYAIDAALKQNEYNLRNQRSGSSYSPIVVELCEWGTYVANFSIIEATDSTEKHDQVLRELFQTCPTLTKVRWFVFAAPLLLGRGNEDGNRTVEYDAGIVVIVRRSNFLAGIELISRSIFPFVAALLVLIIIPTSNTVTRLILRSTKENLDALQGKVTSENIQSSNLDSDSTEAVNPRRQSFLSKLRSRSGVHHRVFDGSTSKEICFEIFHRFRRTLKKYWYLLLPICGTVTTTLIVHILVTASGNASWMISVLFVLTRILMARILYSLWMDAGEAIGFGWGLSKENLSAQILSIIVLLIWLGSVVADAAGGAYDSNRFDNHDSEEVNVAGVVRVIVEISMVLTFTFGLVSTRAPVTKHTCPSNVSHIEQQKYFDSHRNPWPLRVVVTISIVLGAVFLLLWDFGVPPTIQVLPYFFLPTVSAFILMGMVAHCDKTVRHTWPRPRIAIYTLVMTLSLIWLLQWVTMTVCAFWSAVNLSKEMKATCLQELEVEVNHANLLEHGRNSSIDCAASLWLQQGYFRSSTWLLIGWTFASMLLSLFLDYFVETAVSAGEGLEIYFGISMFKAMLSSLVFLSIKPLDTTFYLLLTLKCTQHLATGLGLKSYVWDRYCSKGRWRQDYHTHAMKTTKRTLKAQFGLVAPICSKFVIIALILLEIFQVSLRQNNGDNLNADESEWIPPLTGSMHPLQRLSMVAGFFVQAAFYFCSNEIVETIISNRMEKYVHKVATLETFKSRVLGKNKNKMIFKISSDRCVGRNSMTKSMSHEKIDSRFDGVFKQGSMEMQTENNVKDGKNASKGIANRVSSMFDKFKNTQRNSSNVVMKRRNSISRGGLGGQALISIQTGGKYKWDRHRAEIFTVHGSGMLIWAIYISADALLRMMLARKDASLQ